MRFHSASKLIVHDLDFVHHLNHSPNASHRLLGKLLVVIAAEQTTQYQHTVVALTRHVSASGIWNGPQAGFCCFGNIAAILAQFNSPYLNLPVIAAYGATKAGRRCDDGKLGQISGRQMHLLAAKTTAETQMSSIAARSDQMLMCPT